MTQLECRLSIGFTQAGGLEGRRPSKNLLFWLLWAAKPPTIARKEYKSKANATRYSYSQGRPWRCRDRFRHYQCRLCQIRAADGAQAAADDSRLQADSDRAP